MSSKKSSKRRNNPSVSKAPPPPPRLPGGGYIPRKSQPANFIHWNKFPLLRFDQCLMLLLGIEPGTHIEERPAQVKYDQLWSLIQSCRSAGTLKGKYPFHQDIEPSQFIEWAESIGEPIPEEWKPQNTVVNESEPAPLQTTHSSVLNELVRAAPKRASFDELQDANNAVVLSYICDIDKDVPLATIGLKRKIIELRHNQLKSGKTIGEIWPDAENLRRQINGKKMGHPMHNESVCKAENRRIQRRQSRRK